MHNESRTRTRPRQAARFAASSALGLCGVILLGTLIGTTLAAASVSAGSPSPTSGNGLWPWLRYGLLFAGDIGSRVAWVVLPSGILWLLVRGARRLAVFVAATGLGAIALTFAIHELVPLAHSMTGASTVIRSATFPSALAGGMAVAGGTALLVFLPVIPARKRWRATIGTAIAVLAVGAAPIALGSESVIEVIAGWVLGALWLGTTAWFFRRWREHEGWQRRSIGDGLMPEDRPALVPAPAHDVLAGTSHGLLKLVGAATLLVTVLIGAGVLIVSVLGAIRRFDTLVIEWFVSIRTDALTLVAEVVGALGDTPGIVAVLLVAIPLAFGITRQWAPAVFLLVSAVGETALYLTVGGIVARSRPTVDHLSELPPTSTFPSGHVAASLVTYGGIALLLVAWTRSRLAYAAIILAALITIGVALSRMYHGAHYPTDTLFSILYASAWLAVCWHVFRPARGAPHQAASTARFSGDSRESAVQAQL